MNLTTKNEITMSVRRYAVDEVESSLHKRQFHFYRSNEIRVQQIVIADTRQLFYSFSPAHDFHFMCQRGIKLLISTEEKKKRWERTTSQHRVFFVCAWSVRWEWQKGNVKNETGINETNIKCSRKKERESKKWPQKKFTLKSDRAEICNYRVINVSTLAATMSVLSRLHSSTVSWNAIWNCWPNEWFPRYFYACERAQVKQYFLDTRNN